MTHIKRIIVSFILAVWVINTNADLVHRVGAQADMHYTRDFALPQIKSQYGIGATGNMVYELKDNYFLWQIGAGMGYNYHAIHDLSYADIIGELIDTDGDPCIYSYRLENKKDFSHRIDVVLPFMFGAQVKFLYFLLGAKGRLHLLEEVNTHAEISTMGEYSHLIVPLQAMDNHYFWSEKTIMNHRKIGISGDVLLSGEVGVELPSIGFYSLTSPHWIHRIAVFVEYGVYTSYQKNSSPLIDFHLGSNAMKDIQFEKIEMQPVSFSDRYTKKTRNPFLVGVRWTVLLELPPRRTCVCSNTY